MPRVCCCLVPRSQLHEHYYEVPAPIRDYIQEVKAQLAMLTGMSQAADGCVTHILCMSTHRLHARGAAASCAGTPALSPVACASLCLCTCGPVHPPPSTDWPDAGLDMEEKLSFFRETRHAFGRTALLLSGGGGLGSFHIVSVPSACSTGP